MTRSIGIIAAAGVGLALLAGAPARADIEAVAKAMGTPQSLEIAGSGLFYGIGQAYKPGLPWPRMNLVRYSRTDDYAAGAHGYDYTIVRADQLGGTAVPQRGEFRRAGGVAGDQAWIVNYPAPEAVQAPAVPLQHDLWISPHGIVKAAQAAKVAVVGNRFSIERAGRFRATATLDEQGRVARVESWIDNPVLGDMAVVTTYADYREVGGVRVPMRVNQSAGGHALLDLTVTDVKVNAGGVAVPAQIASVPSEVKLDRAADGVWFVSGGSHNSVVIEMSDHLVLFEAPLGDARTNAVIQAVKAAMPGKPIRYAVASHHHFDHSGGLRAAAAEGAIIVVPEASRGWFEAAWAAPRTLNPDSLARSGRAARFESYGDRHVMGDATRTLELHLIRDNVHADGYVLGWLPRERILIQADSFSPRTPVTQVPAFVTPMARNLWENVQRLALPVETVLPLHGRMVKVDELKLEAGIR